MNHGEGKGKGKRLEGDKPCEGSELPLSENQIRNTASYEGADRSVYVMVNTVPTTLAEPSPSTSQ
jgi:hypothetical protein